MGTTKGRFAKIAWIEKIINDTCRLGYEVDEKKLLAEFSLEFASQERNAKEILQQFEWTGRIHRENGKIYSKEAWEAELSIRKCKLKGDKSVISESNSQKEGLDKEAEEVLAQVLGN